MATRADGDTKTFHHTEMTVDGSAKTQEAQSATAGVVNEHDTLKYHLLGPSLTKAGQDAVDQSKVLSIALSEPYV